MASQVDFAIAVAVFFLFIAFLLSVVLNFYISYVNLAASSELRTTAYNVFNSLFAGRGLPVDWETRDYLPTRIGLISDLYKVPVTVTDTGGASRSNFTVNFTISLDFQCTNRTIENSIRIYNETNIVHPFTLYNKSYCRGSNIYLNQSEFAINLSSAARQSQLFFVYFSGDKNVNATNYTQIAFPPSAINADIKVFPTETLPTLSWSKIRTLRNLVYDRILETLGRGQEFRIEIRDT